MVNQYWAHKSSGETYAIQFNIGHVISACGPLPYTEVTAANLDPWNFNNETEDATWIDESQDEFNLVEAPYAGDIDKVTLPDIPLALSKITELAKILQAPYPTDDHGIRGSMPYDIREMCLKLIDIAHDLEDRVTQ